MSRPTHVGDLAIDGADPGAIYLLRDGHSSGVYGGKVETLHVMSRPAGGQIRGYMRREGDREWRVWAPNYTRDWPEMDAAVAALTGDQVSPELFQ